MSQIKYVVDVTKPPIFPPGRIFRESWLFGECETAESIENGKNWNEYIREYEKQQDKKFPQTI